MTKDYIDGKVTVGEIDEVIFKFKSGKIARAFYNVSGSWTQSGDVLIDPAVLDETFGALQDYGYIEEVEH